MLAHRVLVGKEPFHKSLVDHGNLWRCSRVQLLSLIHICIDLPQYSGSIEIVGVFADFKMNNPRDPIRPVFLRSLAQPFAGYKEPDLISTETNSMFMQAMVLDFNAPQANADALIRHTLAGIDPNLTVMDLRSFGAQVAGNFNGERLIAQLSSLFGILALILASVGIYGVMSY